MLKFFKTYQKSSFFLAHLIIGIIFTLPVIFLISQNLAVDLEKFQEFGKFFEKVKELQGGGLRDLIFHPWQIFSVFSVFFVFHRFLGEPFGFNLFWILLFIFGAMGGYLLFIRFLVPINIGTRNDNTTSHSEERNDEESHNSASNSITIIISFLPGIFFGLLSLYFPITPILLFFLFCLFKFLEKPRVKSAVSALILFLVLVNYSLFIGVSVFLLILIVLVFWIFAKLKISRSNFSQNKTFLIKALILLVLFILIFSAKYYLPLKKVEPLALNDPIFLEQSLDASSLVKPILNYINLQPQTAIFTIQTLIIFIIIVFCLGFFIFAWYSRKKNLMISLAFFLIFLFLVLSLGPYLRFGDNFYQPKIPLPYLALYYYFPFFNQTLEISGFLVYFWIFLIISVSFGINILFERVSITRESSSTSNPLLVREELEKNFIGYRQARIILFTCITILFTLFTFWFFWHPGSQVSSFYLNLAKNKDQFKVLYIDSQKGGRTYLYENSLHSKPLIAKNSMSLDNFENKFKKDTATQFVANYLSNDKNKSSDLIERSDKLSAYLKDANIKYIIFDNKFLDESRGKIVTASENIEEEKRFEDLLKLRKIFRILKDNTEGEWQVIGDKIIYEIAPREKEDTAIYEGDNWGKKDIDQRVLIEEKRKEYLKERWMLNNATLTIENSSSNLKNIELFFRSRSQNELRKLEVYLNENKVSEFIVSPSVKSYIATLNDIKPGKNVVKFRVLDYSNHSVDNIEETAKTNSVQFYEIKYRETISEASIKFYENLDLDNNSKILFLPAEFDKLQNNKNILTYKDLINKQEESVSSMPLLDKLYFGDLGLKSTLDVINRDYYFQTGQETIARYNIKFIALDKNWLEENEYYDLIKFILYNFQVEEISYNDDKFIVLKIMDYDISRQIPFEFTVNWQTNMWDKKSQKFFNIAFDEARMNVINLEGKNINASIKFTIDNSRSEMRKIKVYLNEDWLDDKSLTEFDVLPMKFGEKKQVKIQLDNLRPQKNDLLFRIFDKDDKELTMVRGGGVRMSNFTIEKNEAPIRHKIDKKINLCDEKFRSVLGKNNFSQRFYDDFENEEYTNGNWIIPDIINKPWAIRFSQKYKINRQSIRINNYAQMIKKITSCSKTIEVKMRIRINKWLSGSEFYANFIDSDDDLRIREYKNKSQRGMIRFMDKNFGLYTNKFGYESKFLTDFELEKWIDLKIRYSEGGKINMYSDNQKIADFVDYRDTAPAAFNIMVAGSVLGNLDLNIDDFEIKYE